MSTIKFGTDGWRAIIAKDFTVDNVARVAEACASWLAGKKPEVSVVIGYDCRFGGQLFADTTAKILLKRGVKVYMSQEFVSTPMVSMACIKHKADLGVVITASHNPPEYNGFKLKGSYGGPLLPDQVEQVEKLIPTKSVIDLEKIDLEVYKKNGKLKYVDMEGMYVKSIESNFNLNSMRNQGNCIVYDAMFGAGQSVMERLFPDITRLHCDFNPSFHGQAPEPIARNLWKLSDEVKKHDRYLCGIATDGDADRIGMYDENGDFVDSQHLILLLIDYLVRFKKLQGKVCVAFSVTDRVQKLCEHHGLDVEVVPIGFKHICKVMINEDVLLGGEESGGIAIKGHIPERDGIWVGLTIWEYMVKTGKKLTELISDLDKLTGSFAFERIDLHLTEDVKQRIITRCKENAYDRFGSYTVNRMNDLDGYKFYFAGDSWLMIRPSGTEPVLRTYAEATTKKEAIMILEESHKVLLTC